MESGKYEQQREKEKQLINEIQSISQTHKKEMNEFTKEQEDQNQEVNQLKKTVNETQVEKELHLQYLERQIDGEYAMYNRKYKQMEQNKLKIIKLLEDQLKSEEEVSGSVQQHLQRRTKDLNDQIRQLDQEKEQKTGVLEQQRDKIMADKAAADEENKRIMDLIKKDNEERKHLEDDEKKAEEDERAKAQEKMAMDDATRYIQARWQWYQEEGKFLAKKGKKGRKGKGKKKKK